MRYPNRHPLWLAGLVLVALVAAACGGGDAAEDGGAADGNDSTVTSDLTGAISVSGSATVEPISRRVQELFNEAHPGVTVTLEGPGTAEGFASFCIGETDLIDASRVIQQGEADECAANGIDFVEIQVGRDGVAIVTSANNDAVDCVSFADIYSLIGPESSGFGSWADANALSAQLGGDGDLPAAPLEIFGPGQGTGAFEALVETVLGSFADARGLGATTRSDYNATAEDIAVTQGVRGSDTGLGWVGLALATTVDVKILEVDAGDGCVEASVETLASNEYPLSHPLFIYVSSDRVAASEALVAFVDLYVGAGLDTVMAELGYVPLSEPELVEVRAAWSDARGAMGIPDAEEGDPEDGEGEDTEGDDADGGEDDADGGEDDADDDDASGLGVSAEPVLAGARGVPVA